MPNTLEELEIIIRANTEEAIEKLENLKTEIKGKVTAEFEKMQPTIEQTTEEVTTFSRKSSKNLGATSFGVIAITLAFRKMLKVMTKGFGYLAQYSNKFNTTMSNMKSAWLQAGNSISTAFAPVLQALEPIIVRIAEAITDLFTKIAMYTSAFAGNNFYYKAAKASTNYAESLGKVAKAQNRVLAGFDELNVLSENSSGGIAGMPSTQEMFTTEPIPENVLKNVEKLKQLYENLKPVLAALGGLWLADKVGLTDWIKEAFNANSATKSLTKSMLNKNDALDEQTTDTEKETVALKNLVPKLATVGIGVWALQQALKGLKDNGLEMPSLQPLEAFQNAFEIAKNFVTEKVTSMRDSVSTKVTEISEKLYNAKENIKTNAIEFSNALKTNIEIGVETTKTAIKNWATNIATNTYKAFYNMLENSKIGWTALQKNVNNFIVSTSKGFVSWGENLIENGGKAIKGFVDNFLSGLESAWNSFVSFMQSIGESIGIWWHKNKSWAVPTAISLGVVAAIALAPFTGGSSLLVPALAEGGILTKPTTVLAGEYPGAKSNPEIVAPQSLMYETNVKANVPVINAIEEMSDVLLGALNNMSVYADFGYDKLRVGVKKEDRRVGEKLYGGAYV